MVRFVTPSLLLLLRLVGALHEMLGPYLISERSNQNSGRMILLAPHIIVQRVKEPASSY